MLHQSWQHPQDTEHALPTTSAPPSPPCARHSQLPESHMTGVMQLEPLRLASFLGTVHSLVTTASSPQLRD